jgi:hypothetical protein
MKHDVSTDTLQQLTFPPSEAQGGVRFLHRSSRVEKRDILQCVQPFTRASIFLPPPSVERAGLERNS